MKTFCIAGPVNPEKYYYVPQRLNWNELDQLIDNEFYFVLHAPRQSGKTTAIREYVKHLNETGKYTALYLSTEPAHVAKNDVERAIYWLLVQIDIQTTIQLPDKHDVHNFIQPLLKRRPIPEDSFYRFLQFWSEKNSQPLALFFDEIDGLIEDTLISLLKQFRTGYTNRPKHFPQSICLIGVRDLRDYPSLRLTDFTKEQLRDLYLQHTQATGQQFNDDAIDYAYYLTEGQPWLVNDLAYQACFSDLTDRRQPITKEIFERAKEQLIRRRDTHIDALLDRLNDERIREVIDPIISGSSKIAPFKSEDLQYARDLGLIKQESIEIANPIYKEIIPRELTYTAQETIQAQTAWYLNSDGSLKMHKILKNFTQFFRENSQAWGMQFQYQESMPHLLLMAFLQRIINGGGTICREYALGRKRVDLLVIWQKQCFVIELKIKHGEDTLAKGLEQTANYIDTAAATEGHLILFDRDHTKSWDEKISSEIITFNAKQIHVWTM